MSRIRVLPENLINQIAAGEVVERPASVVKELLENALDASASRVVIDLEAGGRRRIRVADDGRGMDGEDARLALQRHATSKLSIGADLTRIGTMGFRGEALPAIASVSRLTLTTSRDGTRGVRITVEGGRILDVTEAGHPAGTTVDVQDLFFNTPARAKFLRTPPTELGRITGMIDAYTITIPEIALSLTHDGRTLLNLAPAADAGQRLQDVFGNDWSRATRFDASRGPFRASGWVLPPRAEVSLRRLQSIYVNGRFVKDRLLGHAVMSACEEFFPKGRHAAVFLFVDCPPESVDVNVHPAKAEIRFIDTRTPHELVREALRSALRSALPVTPFPDTASGEAARRIAADQAPSVHEAAQAYMRNATILDPSAARPTRVRATDGDSQPQLLADTPEVLGHFRESYILAADTQGLLLVDQHAAHERILYERLLKQGPVTTDSPRQALMFPITIQVPRHLRDRLDPVAAELDRLGFTAEPFGEGTLLVREVPSILGAGDMSGLTRVLLEQLGEEGSVGPVSEERRRSLTATVACHAAIKVRMPLSTEKMNYLINELCQTDTPLKCPHGRPAVLRFALEEIERGFDRR